MVKKLIKSGISLRKRNSTSRADIPLDAEQTAATERTQAPDVGAGAAR